MHNLFIYVPQNKFYTLSPVIQTVLTSGISFTNDLIRLSMSTVKVHYKLSPFKNQNGLEVGFQNDTTSMFSSIRDIATTYGSVYNFN